MYTTLIQSASYLYIYSLSRMSRGSFEEIDCDLSTKLVVVVVVISRISVLFVFTYYSKGGTVLLEDTATLAREVYATTSELATGSRYNFKWMPKPYPAPSPVSPL